MSNINNIINDIQVLIEGVDNASNEYLLELTEITDTKISNYQILIAILFLLIICGTFYVLYRDYIYRIADKMTRCTDINDIINLNINDNDNSYIYNIYIAHVNNTNNVAKEFVIKFEYNFIAEQTNITFGQHSILSPVLFAPSDNISKMSNAFYVFDLAEKKKRYVDYYDKDNNKVYFIDRKKLATKKYKYYITSSLDEKLSDKNSILLAQFIKKYGYNDNINLDPIYNILYAIESKKNMEY
jgi:hypothetical protein|uniref:Uncharacterized protein n=1 Tax=viral metagenome TaxID=1070528 RepID=A0A6C0CFH3_9ZZZZ